MSYDLQPGNGADLIIKEKDKGKKKKKG